MWRYVTSKFLYTHNVQKESTFNDSPAASTKANDKDKATSPNDDIRCDIQHGIILVEAEYLNIFKDGFINSEPQSHTKQYRANQLWYSIYC